MSDNSAYSGFRLQREEFIKEIEAKALYLEHEKTGAECIVIECDDDNKVFCISFRTPPDDDTGVAHIIEHSVLNGSKKYPVKEPFAELLKASLYTFLNAMTYPDKTVYPVASRNDQDFENLMDVYLDAVFNPILSKETYMQEGWHHSYDENDKLAFTGVVYNEMLGASSSPERMLHNHLQAALTPDNIYAKDSGGDPEHIPDLSFEQFTNFHKRFYHPSNSKTVLYGKLDLKEKLAHLDRYFSAYDKVDADSAIVAQAAFDTPVTLEESYPVSDGEELQGKSYVTRSWLLDSPFDAEFNMAFNILSRILTGTSASPVKRALIDSHLGKDCFHWYSSSHLQCSYAITLKGTDPENADQVHELIEKTLAAIVKDGLDPKIIDASMNAIEFNLREANYGGYSKGIVYALNMLSTWLYDKNPFVTLAWEEPLATIKTKVAEGPYFEDMIQKYLVSNKHQVSLLMKPDKDYEKKRLARLEENLQNRDAQFTDAERSAIKEDCKRLHALQLQPDSPEALATIPRLPLSSVDRQAEFLPFELCREEASYNYSFSEQDTHGIAYLKMYFNAAALTVDELPYLPFLAKVLRQAGTAKRNYAEMTQEIDINTGGINFSHTTRAILGTDKPLTQFAVHAKALGENIPAMLSLINELLFDPRFENHERMCELAQMALVSWEGSIKNGGNAYVGIRLQAYESDYGRCKEWTDGLMAYEGMKEIQKILLSDPEQFVKNLKAVHEKVILKGLCHIHLTASKDVEAQFVKEFEKVLDGHQADSLIHQDRIFPALTENEGIVVPSKVQYVGKGLKLIGVDQPFHGDMQVLSKLLGRDYLWNTVRVQGNAYGCFASLDKLSGQVSCISDRDPNLAQTLSTFDQISDYLAGLDMSRSDFEKIIIGTIGGIDQPNTPDQNGAIALNRYFAKLSGEMIQQQRDELLDSRLEHIKKYAEMFKTFARDGKICVVGSEEVLKSEEKRFAALRYPLS